mmetsp:Transcript_26970/g.87135  ORF Transcript_26970/g.87135 Transcript_26970/m.87135 type:complete len:487 (-) Transcript_26970:170-1630(-)
MQVTGTTGKVLAVHEDWNGGAGNGLGTLYAYKKARDKASGLGYDLDAMLSGGSSVALYHTAGKGTRLAPLPGAENNNKPGVKLPALLDVGGVPQALTVLEAVMRQTSSYASARGGRISVFWGDQVFVPSAGITKSTHAADILAALRPMPSKEEWEASQLHQYGLIALGRSGDATQLEKVTYDTAMAYLPADVDKVGTSLGSFSLSAKLLMALMDEFAPELHGKTACLDSDPHFWMPLTLRRDDYLAVMTNKGDAAEASAEHYDRMAAFKAKFQPDGGSLLGCVDVGAAALWWDYGRLELYQINNLHTTEVGLSPHLLRTFLKLQPVDAPESDTAGRQQGNRLGAGVAVDPTSVMLNCRIGAGRIGAGCVLVNVTAPTVDVDKAILMGVTSAAPVEGKCGVLYNVVHELAGEPLSASAVRADVFMSDGRHLPIKSSMATDGGKAWKQTLDGNELSFEGVYKANQALSVAECQKASAAAHARVAALVA